MAEKKLCECGCGGEVTRSKQPPYDWNRFIAFHHLWGRKLSEEAKQKIRIAQTGNHYGLGYRHTPEAKAKIGAAHKGNKYNLGYKHTEKAKRNMTLAQTGKKHSEETKRKISIARTGFKHAEEFKKKCRARMLGSKHTEETKLKIGRAHKGHSYLLGRKHSEERKLRNSGPLNPNWKGGIANEPYCDLWGDKQNKEDLKEAFDYICQMCGKVKTKVLVIHHIDYVKKNCVPWNLIPLCNGCNSRANFNREYWTQHFNTIMASYYPERFIER